MKNEPQRSLIDADEVTAANAVVKRGAAGRRAVVELDRDHPGFRDAAYRERRDLIATIALEHAPGTPVPPAPYTEEEHALWRQINAEIAPVHARYACAIWLEGWTRLQLPTNRIPQLDEVSTRLRTLTGFSFEPVAGLVMPRIFLETLADRVMLCTQYIRHHSRPYYTPEPDVVHELIGHAPFFTQPTLTEISLLFGRAARLADAVEIERLIRLYWFTVEFGVAREEGRPRAYGAGLLSSIGEMKGLEEIELRPFDIEVMAATDFDPTDYQPFLFCAESMDEVIGALRGYLGADAE